MNARLKALCSPDQKTGCWLWTGALNNKGYGVIKIGGRKGKLCLAHRVSYETYVESIPSQQCVLHHCDVRNCINPKHLFIGTNKENSEDMVIKERSARGERQGTSKLTATDVLSIRKDSRMHRVIAADFGISRTNVGVIKSHKSWKHI